MNFLDKYIVDPNYSVFHAQVYFGDEEYWIGNRSSPISYCEILTQVLNYDLAPYRAALEYYLDCFDRKDSEEIVAAHDNLYLAFGKLPLYEHFYRKKNHPYRTRMELIGDDREETLAKYIFRDTSTRDRYLQVRDDIEFIQGRYAWFLDEMLGSQDSGKKKGQRKIPLAEQIAKANLSSLVIDASLGENKIVDLPSVEVQYLIRETDTGNAVVEMFTFSRILDFVYVELMRGIQKGYVPKRCANCGRWFLQTPGVSYAYCDRIAPGETEKTCRDIGAVTSFQDKVRNNEIWQTHQRAYKKYYARVLKNNMTKEEFTTWAKDAEKLRDKALSEYELVQDDDRLWIIAKLKQDLNEK